MNQLLDNILKDLKKRQTNNRYDHTVSVMYTAAALCMRYGEDVNKGMLAGVLHDCGKLAEYKDYLAICQEFNIPINEDGRHAPHLLHADLGAYFARERYFVTDEEILHAVKVHTTGCPNMSLLDKIVFIADFIEPNREELPNLEHIRKLAFENLDECIAIVAHQTIEYLKSKQYYIGKTTIETYNYYKK